jgi:predicted phosphodiesterase
MKILDSALEKVDKPWIAVCGNHDTASDIPDGYLYSRIKEPVQVLDLGDLILFGVDNSQRQITADQTAQLHQVLSQGKPVIVVMHIPIMTEENHNLLMNCGDYFRLNHPESTEETLAFIDCIRQNAGQIVAVLAGHLHFHNESQIAPGLPQFVNSQSVLGNINRYEIGE